MMIKRDVSTHLKLFLVALFVFSASKGYAFPANDHVTPNTLKITQVPIEEEKATEPTNQDSKGRTISDWIKEGRNIIIIYDHNGSITYRDLFTNTPIKIRITKNDAVYKDGLILVENNQGRKLETIDEANIFMVEIIHNRMVTTIVYSSDGETSIVKELYDAYGNRLISGNDDTSYADTEDERLERAERIKNARTGSTRGGVTHNLREQNDVQYGGVCRLILDDGGIANHFMTEKEADGVLSAEFMRDARTGKGRVVFNLKNGASMPMEIENIEKTTGAKVEYSEFLRIGTRDNEVQIIYNLVDGSASSTAPKLGTDIESFKIIYNTSRKKIIWTN